MLGRAPRPWTVCLRCQVRLVENRQPWQRSTAPFDITRPCLRRQTTTATVQLDHENQTHEHSQDSTTRNPDSESNAEPKKPRNPTRYRTWRPNTVQGLGIDVLGKPAEVLIVPQRDPKTSRPKSEKNYKIEKIGLQASLDSELVPISIDEAIRNIDSLKADLGQDEVDFALPEWKNHRRRLSDGFTRLQLQEYLRVACGRGDVPTQNNSRSSSSQKRELATSIMQKAWGWTCTDITESQKSQPTVRRTVSLDPLKLEFILRDEKQPLRQISESCGVQVDVFKDEGRIEISGPAQAAGNANVRVKQLAKTIQESSLLLTPLISSLLNDESQLKDPLGKLMQKHNMLIKEDGNTLKIVNHKSNGAGVVSRDLLMFSGRFRTASSFSVWRYEPRHGLVKVPFYPDDAPEWLTQAKSWYRHVSQTARYEIEDTTTEAGQREARRKAGNLSKSLLPDKDFLSRFHANANQVRLEYTVDIGHVLFNRPDSDDREQFDHDWVYSPPEGVAKTLFVPYVSLLPQVLAKKDFFPVQSKNDGRMATSQSFLLRLRLHPVERDTDTPSLEIILSGTDISLGLRQQLEIKKTVFTLAKRQHDLLLPHQPVDVRVTARHEVSLLGSATTKPTKRYLKILQQIGSFLERAQSSEHGEFEPFWDLDISGLLRGDAASPQNRAKQPSSLSHGQANLSETGALGTDRDTGSASTTLYVLEPPEYLDVATYTSVVTGANLLQSISCDAGPVEKPAQRQTLQIVDTSLSDLLPGTDDKNKSVLGAAGSRQEQFKNALAAAHDLATLLGKYNRSAANPPSTA